MIEHRRHKRLYSPLACPHLETFYAHFVDKYDILDQVIGERFREVLTTRVSAASPFNLDNLRVLFVTVLESLAEFHDHCRRAVRGLDLPIQTKMQQELYELLKGRLGQYQPAEAEEWATRETAATLMSWAIFGAGIEWSRGTRELSADGTARQIVGLLNGGLARVAIAPSPAKQERQRGSSGERPAPKRLD